MAMEIHDGLSNNDAMATEITDHNNKKYLSYSHEGTGKKSKLPTYDSNTNILHQATTEGTISTAIADAGVSTKCARTAAEQK